MQDSEHPSIVGYQPCKRCGTQELKYLMHQTGGLCWSCIMDDPVVKRSKELEVSHRGLVASVRNASAGRARRKTTHHSVNASVRQLTIRRALHRLRDRHFEEYHMLLQEERIAAGWPPKVAMEENIIGRAIETMAARLRYLRFIPPEDLDADSPNTQG